MEKLDEIQERFENLIDDFLKARGEMDYLFTRINDIEDRLDTLEG